MRYRPPKGVAPPQLDGRRSGRPKGRKTHAAIWADILWAYDHRFEGRSAPPTPAALWWWRLAVRYPDEVEEFLQAWGRI